MPLPDKQQRTRADSPWLSRKREEKKQSVRYSIGFLVLVGVVALAIYALLFGFILNKKDAIVEKISKLDTEQLKEEQLRALRDSFRETESGREALARYFIDSGELVVLIEDIEQAGRHANVLAQFRFVNIRTPENILAMEFEAIGSFSEIFYFLQLVENVPLRISFEKFLLDKEIPRTFEKRKESDTWHALFTIAVLSFDSP